MFKIVAKVDARLNRLERALARQRRTVLFRTAGYTLKVFVRQPIKTRKKSAARGATPTSKPGKKLKRNTAFVVRLNLGEADIGFSRFPSQHAQPLGGKSIPETLLLGGGERLHLPARTVTSKHAGRDASGRFVSVGRTVKLAPKTVTASYLPRPALLDNALRKGGEKLLENHRSVPLR